MMPKKIWLDQTKNYMNSEVCLQAWIFNKRQSKKIIFLELRDGSLPVQAIVTKNDSSEEVWQIAEKLTQESTVEVCGTVVEHEKSKAGCEIIVKKLTPIQITENFPITKKEHGTEFLNEHRHLWLRSRKQKAILELRNEIIYATRSFFYNQNYICTDSPILTGTIGEEGSTLFSTEYFDLGNAYLAQTGQLYIEATCAALGRVYCFGPTFRAEKSKTRKHLTEFWMLEAETAFADNNDNMDLQEELFKAIVRHVLEKCQDQLTILERDTKPLEIIAEKPFARISYDDAIYFLHKKGSQIECGKDLGAEDEILLTEDLDVPLFVMNYPREAKAFYMKIHPENPDRVLCSDLLAPSYGEVMGASQREDDYDILLKRIKEFGFEPEKFSWYLDLRKYGTFVHSGFGMGLERMVSFIGGVHHVRETIPFARTIYNLEP
jgi:asparaginyl-tRNA synthetase